MRQMWDALFERFCGESVGKVANSGSLMEVFCDGPWGGPGTKSQTPSCSTCCSGFVSISGWTKQDSNANIIYHLYLFCLYGWGGLPDWRTSLCLNIRDDGFLELCVGKQPDNIVLFYYEACSQINARVDSPMWWYEREFANYSRILSVWGIRRGRGPRSHRKSSPQEFMEVHPHSNRSETGLLSSPLSFPPLPCLQLSLTIRHVIYSSQA